jgi:hypothetical protein
MPAPSHSGNLLGDAERPALLASGHLGVQRVSRRRAHDRLRCGGFGNRGDCDQRRGDRRWLGLRRQWRQHRRRWRRFRLRRQWRNDLRRWRSVGLGRDRRNDVWRWRSVGLGRDRGQRWARLRNRRDADGDDVSTPVRRGLRWRNVSHPVRHAERVQRQGDDLSARVPLQDQLLLSGGLRERHVQLSGRGARLQHGLRHQARLRWREAHLQGRSVLDLLRSRSADLCGGDRHLRQQQLHRNVPRHVQSDAHLRPVLQLHDLLSAHAPRRLLISTAF